MSDWPPSSKAWPRFGAGVLVFGVLQLALAVHAARLHTDMPGSRHLSPLAAGVAGAAFCFCGAVLIVNHYIRYRRK